jgi:hypothetical protein
LCIDDEQGALQEEEQQQQPSGAQQGLGAPAKGPLLPLAKGQLANQPMAGRHAALHQPSLGVDDWPNIDQQAAGGSSAAETSSSGSEPSRAHPVP